MEPKDIFKIIITFLHFVLFVNRFSKHFAALCRTFGMQKGGTIIYKKSVILKNAASER